MSPKYEVTVSERYRKKFIDDIRDYVDKIELIAPAKQSPPLSKIELEDIEQSMKEFESGDMIIFDNVEDFIKSLQEGG